MLPQDGLAQAAAHGMPVDRVEPPDRAGEAIDVVVDEAELVGQQRVERRVRGDDRKTGRGRLVDDLVGRAGAHVVDERVDLGIEAGDGVVRRRAEDVDAVEQAELDHEPFERDPVQPLLLRHGRADHL